MEVSGNIRPNRSDVHVSKEEEAKIEETTREYFDGIAPKRHTKPQRSEYSSTYVDQMNTTPSDGTIIPENLEFQRLENDTQKLVYNGSGQVTEEFVETEYYKDLNCVDKQHHTTGTGFIKVGNGNGNTFNIGVDSGTDSSHVYKGNPATNDWIPSPVDEVGFISDKPNRSDN
ncbi:putative phosphomethylpyrimidine synthase, chloroplastic-like [Capsicum annuum]|uniref:Maternal effect embryo arrest 59 n=1 Tax=Capsicum annuum TaxID=4072 RepID=A0A1U8H419_CAPAN|nr:uncharacterized protein LOC107873479 [Capsicum annuum]KAF3624641.1 putative phosphomethylpyrimidine synthase, chloroplastic-like [Capsicum annuum]KAF3656531.1 putative phosphomethylpyrimidine synthase, chloroplastic-like [Capsicum annuum]PHT78157.1 hypothetical protein T459_16209 [Capsicum annuum]